MWFCVYILNGEKYFILFIVKIFLYDKCILKVKLINLEEIREVKFFLMKILGYMRGFLIFISVWGLEDIC